MQFSRPMQHTMRSPAFRYPHIIIHSCSSPFLNAHRVADSRSVDKINKKKTIQVYLTRFEIIILQARDSASGRAKLANIFPHPLRLSCLLVYVRVVSEMLRRSPFPPHEYIYMFRAPKRRQRGGTHSCLRGSVYGEVRQ